MIRKHQNIKALSMLWLKALSFGFCLTVVAAQVVQAQTRIGPVLPKGGDRVTQTDVLRSDGASYYHGPRILQKILTNYGITVSVDQLTLDSNTQYGVSTYQGLKAALEKYGLYAQVRELSFEQAKTLAVNHTLLITVSRNKILAYVQSIDERAVELYSPFLYNKQYKMPVNVFHKQWSGDTLVISDQPLPFLAQTALKSGTTTEGSIPVVARAAGGGCGNVNAFGGKTQPDPTVVGDPIIVNNGSFDLVETDLTIAGVGFPLEIKRAYNSQIFSDITGWDYEKGSGGWLVENGIYHGYGDISVANRFLLNPTISADVRTVQPGDSLLEIGGLTFNYTDEKTRYFFRAAQQAGQTYLFLARRENDIQTWLVDGYLSPVSVDPLQWNNIRVTSHNGQILVYLNQQLVLNHTDPNPLPPGQAGLESHFSYAQFDNVVITDSGQTDQYDFNTDDNHHYVLGFGWQFTYGMRINETDRYVIVHRADGRRDKFIKETNGTFTPPTLVFDQLIRWGGGYRLTSLHKDVYDFNASGQLTSMTDRSQNTLSLFYTGGRLTTVQDAVGRQLTFTYHANGKVDQITDPAGRTFMYGYDSEGNLTQVTDPNGHTRSYGYGPLTHLLTSIVNPEGDTYSYTYLYNRHLNQLIDPLGQVTTMDYLWDTTIITNQDFESYSYHFDETNDRLISETTPDFVSRFYTYNADETVATMTDRNNNPVSMTHNSFGQLTSETRVDHQGQNVTIQMSYDPQYQFIQTVTDAEGQLTRYDYDAQGNLTKITSPAPDLHETVMTYYPNGLLKTKRDANNHLWQYHYDANGYLDKITDPKLNETLYVYNVIGNLMSVTDANGHQTQFEYDQNNNRTKVISPAPDYFETLYDYDKNNNLIKVTYPDTSFEEYTYDQLQNKASEKRYPDGAGGPVHTVTYTYDTIDYMSRLQELVKTVTDANGYTTTYEHNHQGDVTAEIDEQLNRTEYTYDFERHLTSVKDALDQQTDYELKGTDGWVTKITYEDNTTELFDYDSSGNLLSKTDQNGTVMIYQYDTQERLIREYDPASPSFEFTYSYDPVGNLQTATSAQGTITYTYDALNRVETITYPGSEVVEYNYDPVGNVSQLIYPDGMTLVYSYDSHNRLIDIHQGGQKLVEYQYDALNRISRREYDNGTETLYQYDQASRLKMLRNQWDNGTAIDHFDYTHDPAGQILSITSPEGTTHYAYDDIYQLTDVQDYDQSMTHYDYDALGNRNQVDVDGVIADYNHANGLNQIDSVTYNGATSPQYITVRGVYDEAHVSTVTVNGQPATVDPLTQSFAATSVPVGLGLNTILAQITDQNGLSSSQSIDVTVADNPVIQYNHDNNGNVTQVMDGSNTRTYQYDQKNRLLQVSDLADPGGEAHYVYDVFNRRSRKTVSGASTDYIYDKDGQVIYETLTTPSTFWQEDFNPVQPGWLGTTGTWNCQMDGQGVVSVVNSFPQSWGHVYSPPLVVNVDQNPYVTVDVGSVSPGANFTLEIQTYGTSYAKNFPTAVQQVAPGQYQVDLRSLMGWSGVRSFYVGVWVGGGAGRSIDLDRIHVGGSTVSQSTRYIYGPGIDNIVLMQDPQGQNHYYHHNHQGSVTAITDQSGWVMETYEYEAFGETKIFDPYGTLLSQSLIGNHYGFTGRRFDIESGLYYYRARYYDPDLGRFLQRDPIGYGDGLNVYAYVGNDPVNLIDPWGLAEEWKKYGYASKEEYLRAGGESDASIPFWEDPAFVVPFVVAGGSGVYKIYRDGKATYDFYWRYFNESNKNGNWLTGKNAKKAPYGKNYSEAKNSLQIPKKPTRVKKVKVPKTEQISGPRTVKGNPQWGKGGGIEYYRGPKFPE